MIILRICTALVLLGTISQVGADDWLDRRRTSTVFADDLNGDIVYWERDTGRYRARTIIILGDDDDGESIEEEDSEESEEDTE